MDKDKILHLLEEFEQHLNPANTKKSKIPVQILGYGEISTVIAFDHPELKDLAFKRMPIFSSCQQTNQYADLYFRYNELLSNQGLNIPPSYAFCVKGHGQIYVAYLAQQKLNPQSIGNRVLHTHPDEQIILLFSKIINQIKNVWKHNATNPDFLIGLDAQISNWAIKDFNTNQEITQDTELWFLDTSTPMIRISGQEQINPLLFLTSAPPGLRWVLKKFFLQDVLDRYYDLRQVAIDLVANLYKEQRPDLITRALEIVNNEAKDYLDTPITVKEVSSYYKEDKFIWSFYLSARRLDRFFKTKLLGRRYEFILPGKIKR